MVAGWAENGYFNDDTNGTDGTAALGRFTNGESLFFFSGSWDASALQDQMGDNVGFVLAPVGESGAPPLGMSDPVSNFGIPANSDEKDAAAAFLNFLLSPEARQIVVDTGAGPSGTGAPPETEPGTLKAAVQEGFADLVDADGQVQFVQNATSGINADWIAQTQELVEGRVSPEDYLANIQAAYEEQLPVSTLDSTLAGEAGRQGACAGTGARGRRRRTRELERMALRPPGPGHVRRVRAPTDPGDHPVLLLRLGRHHRRHPGRHRQLPAGADRPRAGRPRSGTPSS